jgi:segregation and condensation protein B
VLGRREIPGRPLIYATTKRFLEVFDLKNLKDLPTPKEIEEFGSALSENMDAAADDAQGEPESPPEEAPETASETLESEASAENQETSTEVDEPKPDQDA